mgnify:CR=1 FL=1
MYEISGIALEIIVIIKIFAAWIFFHFPFFIILPLACLILNIDQEKTYLLMFTFLISSPIITNILSISSSMNLLNEKNFTIGSLIVMLFSIPIIIFSVNMINLSEEFFYPQMNILLGILLLFLSITPWVCSACIKISIRNK